MIHRVRKPPDWSREMLPGHHICGKTHPVGKEESVTGRANTIVRKSLSARSVQRRWYSDLPKGTLLRFARSALFLSFRQLANIARTEFLCRIPDACHGNIRVISISTLLVHRDGVLGVPIAQNASTSTLRSMDLRKRCVFCVPWHVQTGTCKRILHQIA